MTDGASTDLTAAFLPPTCCVCFLSKLPSTEGGGRLEGSSGRPFLRNDGVFRGFIVNERGWGTRGSETKINDIDQGQKDTQIYHVNFYKSRIQVAEVRQWFEILRKSNTWWKWVLKPQSFPCKMQSKGDANPVKKTMKERILSGPWYTKYTLFFVKPSNTARMLGPVTEFRDN